MEEHICSNSKVTKKDRIGGDSLEMTEK